MNPKTKRISAIRNLIENNHISSQEQLIRMLGEMGFDATQSTLSRDLRFMNVAKVPTDNDYRYVLSDGLRQRRRETSVSSVITENIMSADFSGNICVIRTASGYANAVTVIIDSHELPEVMGTLAGDDTIIMVLREDADRATLLRRLHEFLPSLG